MKKSKQAVCVYRKRSYPGQLLLEALIAAVVLLILTSGIVVSVLVGVRNTTYAKQRTLATSYAQQALAIAKNTIEHDWDFSAVAGNQYPVTGTHEGIDTLTLTVDCLQGGGTPPNCTPPIVRIQATASWTRTTGSTPSEVVMTSLVVKQE